MTTRYRIMVWHQSPGHLAAVGRDELFWTGSMKSLERAWNRAPHSLASCSRVERFVADKWQQTAYGCWGTMPV